jgi:amino acid adenylation domain-containing protein
MTRFNSVQECFARQATLTPEAVAVAAQGTRMTYRALDQRSNQLAHLLLRKGILPEEPVGVLMERSADLIVAILAIVKAGASYLPVHNAYPMSHMQRIMNNAGRPLLIADAMMQRKGLPTSKEVILADQDLSAFQSTDPEIRGHPDQLVYVMHTSGTEGQPLGVAVRHRGVLGLALDSCWDEKRHERLLMLAPHAFGVSTYELWVPLLHGGRIVIPPSDDITIASLRNLIRDEKITALHLTAGLFRVVAEEAPECLAGVLEVLTGGDVIPPNAVQRVIESCPGTVVRAMYGATEVSSFAASCPMKTFYSNGANVLLGRPLDDVAIYILDEDLNELPPGTAGELYVGGERLARGYAGRPDLTAARFVADPIAGNGARMYRTGDLARWTPDKMIDFIGRASDLVKIRGFRVAPTEVEHALSTFPGLVNAVVVPRENDIGERQLIAYVVAEAGDVDVNALRNYLKNLIPEYMIPAAFVVLGKLPLTPNGKVDRRALPDPVLYGASAFRAPSTERQKALCSLFAEILGLSSVDVGDSFFELGGQSMLAIRLTHRIEAALSVELTIQDLFDAPSVAELDQRIESILRQAQMANPFDDESATYLVITNAAGQYSLWPAAWSVADGWTVVHGPVGRAACLGYVAEHWAIPPTTGT